MGSIHLPIHPDAPISEILSELPKAFRAFLKEGFRTLGKVSADRYLSLTRAATESYGSPYGAFGADFAAKLGLERQESQNLLGAASFLIAILSEAQETANQFMEAAASQGILDDEHKGAVLKLAEIIISEKSAIRDARERLSVASALLPSLTTFRTEVDVRLRFDKGIINLAVPVGLIHIDTDFDNEEVCFQLTRNQLEGIIEDLKETLRRVQEAERWAGRVSSTKG